MLALRKWWHNVVTAISIYPLFILFIPLRKGMYFNNFFIINELEAVFVIFIAPL